MPATPERTRVLALVLGVSVLVACSESTASRLEAVTHDSAGIQIIEYPDENADALWRIDADPFLEVGSTESDSATVLYRVQGAVRTSSGHIVVADGASVSLKVFAPDGTYLRAIGRQGQGPGEFVSLTSVWSLSGDTILLWDGRNQRLSVFDTAGTLLGTVPLHPPQGRPDLLGFAEDGTFVVASSSGSVETRPRVTQDRWEIVRYEPAASAFDTLSEYAGAESWDIVDPSGRPGRMQPPFHLAGFLGATVVDGIVHSVSPPTYALTSMDLNGSLVRIVRWPLTREPVDPDVVVAAWLTPGTTGPGGEQARGQVEKMIRSFPFPDSTPPLVDLQRDDEGNVWVEQFRWPSDSLAQWTIVDPTGALLATAQLPGDLQILHIERDFVLCLWRDDLGVEHVRVYRLQKKS